MSKKSIIFLGTTSYSYPLNNTQEKKFSTLSQYHDISVIAFSNKGRFKTFKKGASFYLLPYWPGRALRFLLLILGGPILVLRLAKRGETTFLIAQDPHQGFAASLTKSLGKLIGKRIKLIVENHGDFERSIFIQKKIGANKFNKKVFSWLAKFTFKRADALRGVSVATVDQLKKWNNKLPVIKFPAWTDIEVFSSVKQKDQLTNPTIIFAGVLAPIKGVEYLIEAFNKIVNHYPQAKLLLVGKEEDQQYVADLKQRIKDYNLYNNVEFVGEVSQQQLADMFSRSHVFVLPSLSEGLGRVVFEAMAAGLPVVGSRVGGVPDLIDDGITGWLIEPRDVNNLTEKILRLITNSVEAKLMGEKGREFAKTFFSSSSYLASYNTLFTLAEGGRKPDFIGLGAQRSGTSWIYACLYEHPQIFSPVKEINFFSRERNWPKGYSWYESILKGGRDNQLVGEFSTSYLANPDTPERIWKRYPKTKLIISLRDPADRAFSNYLNDIKTGVIKASVSFKEALEKREEYIINSMYATHIKRYFKLFPREQILILFYEDLKQDPKAFINRIYYFIGIDSDFVPSTINKKINTGRVPRLVWVDRFLIHISKVLRKFGAHKIWWFIKRKGWGKKVRKINTQTMQLQLSREDRNLLNRIFEKEIGELEEILGYKIKLWQK